MPPARSAPPLPVVIDCDPGKDDAFALFLALAMPEALRPLAITAVAGNVALAHTACNARRIVEAAGRGDLPVHAGCAGPLAGAGATAEHVHGTDGLGGSGLPPPQSGPQPPHAAAALARLLMADAPPVVAALGPLTNLAVALEQHPAIAARIARLVIMGGARERGNVTPHAEFNIHVDPEAAARVLAAVAPVTLVTLDATRRLLPAAGWFQAMAGFGAPGRAVAAMWRPCRLPKTPLALHDAAVTALLLWPELFTLEACAVDVVLEGEQRGRTLIRRGAGPHFMVAGLEREALLERMAAAMARYGPA